MAKVRATENKGSKIPLKKGNFSLEYIAAPTPILVLKEGDLVWTEDIEKEKTSQQFAVDKCSGKVLVGGLGLGLIVEMLAEKDDVTEIIVVEIAQEVIELVWDRLNTKGKGKIVCDSIENFLKTTTEKFDYIYLDVWKDVSYNSYHNVLLPLRRLAERLVPPEDVLCWQEKKMRKMYGRKQE